jgi:TatD DNase family protein
MTANAPLASLFDAHNHLQDLRLGEEKHLLIQNTRSIGITGMAVNGTQESDWSIIESLATQYTQIVPCFGLHPWFINTRSTNWLEALKCYLNKEGSCIGEIGLDHWIKGVDHSLQETVFCAQWELAVELKRPLMIHCLKAWHRMLPLLRKLPKNERGFLLHSYSGTAAMVEELTDLGAYFSVSGYFLHERKRRALDIFKLIPIERLLIETDAPDMCPPVDHIALELKDNAQNALNHPANLRSIAHGLADKLGIDFHLFAEQTTANARTFFGIRWIRSGHPKSQ